MKVTERFSNRVENYIRYRPDYPGEIIGILESEAGLSGQACVADIGSGTGILTEILLKHGNTVIAVEPNKAMREAAEQLLAGYENFISMDGSAESTGIKDGSADLVTAAQAFHWFRQEEFARECRRILKPGAFLTLIWNERRTDVGPFLQGYEQLLLDFATDYSEVNHRNIDDSELERFFSGTMKKFTLGNHQYFDLEGLKGRLLSSSYVPTEESADYRPMIDRLHEIFDKYSEDGRVVFEYSTNLYIGRP